MDISEKLDICEVMSIEWDNWFNRSDFSDDLDYAVEEVMEAFLNLQNKESRHRIKKLFQVDEPFAISHIKELLND